MKIVSTNFTFLFEKIIHSKYETKNSRIATILTILEFDKSRNHPSLICYNIQRLMIRQHQMLTHHVMVDGLMNLLIFLHQM